MPVDGGLPQAFSQAQVMRSYCPQASRDHPARALHKRRDTAAPGDRRCKHFKVYRVLASSARFIKTQHGSRHKGTDRAWGLS